MALAFSILVGGLEVLNLSSAAVAANYGVEPDSMQGFGEAEVDAEYADSADRHGSGLSSRRFRNRVVSFQLWVRSSAGVDARESARNAVANVLDKARRYQTGEVLGTTAAEGEVVVKYCPPNGSSAVYARVIDGSLGTSDFYSSVGSFGSAAGQSVDIGAPVTLVLEPFWRPERDFYLRNCLLNGGFEAGYTGSAPHGWTPGTSGTIGATSGQSLSFVRSGSASHYMHIDSSTTSGTITATQNIILADVGVSAGQTILVSAWVYLYSLTATGRAYVVANDGDAHTPTTAITNTTGQWVRLWMVVDIASAAASVAVTLTVQAQNIGDTILAYWDEIQVQPHVDNLLLGGGFSHDADVNGTADFWSNPGPDAGITATSGVASTGIQKYDGTVQEVAITAATASGTISIHQDVTLATHNIKAVAALTFGAYLAPLVANGTFVAYLQIQFLDANSRIVSLVQSSNLVTTALNVWSWLSASAAVPSGQVSTARCRIVLLSGGSGGTGTIRADWATCYRGHSDQTSRRFWPWSDRSEVLLPVWSDSARLTSDPSATDGKQIALDHTGLPGNVPGPCQLVIGCSAEIPNPLIVGYKRGVTALTPWVATIDGTIINEVAATSADADAIGSVADPGKRRIWTPATTNETLLLNWSGADAPPGRYLILVRAKLSDSTHYGRYSFRAAARLDNANTAAGTWSLILHSAPAWVNTTGTAGYEIWSAGVIPLPLRSRLPSYINATRFELWARASATGGTVSLDAVYFLPLDGFAKLEKSFYAVAGAANGNAWRYTALIDSITPLPGGLYSNTVATFPTLLPSTFDDQPDAEEEPIYLGDQGQLTVIASGALHVKTYSQMMAILYRPWFSTAGVVS